MLAQDKVVYSDILVNFERHPINKDLVRAVNEDAVRRALKNIILTNRGEVPYQPNRGGNIRRYLFEQMSPQTAQDIKDDVWTAISNEEPRVNLLEVKVIPNYGEQHYTVVIIYTLLNEATARTVNITLERIQ